MNKNHTCTTLIEAVRKGDAGAVSELLEDGANVNEQCSCDERTALHWAASFHGYLGYPVEILKSLLVPEANVNIPDHRRDSLLSCAVQSYLHSDRGAAILNDFFEIIKMMSVRANEPSLREGIKKYSPSTPRRQKMIEYLQSKLAQLTPIENVDIQDYKKTISTVSNIWKKRIKPFYDRNLTSKRLAQLFLKLKQEDEHHNLPKFRSQYHGYIHAPSLSAKARERHSKLNAAIKRFDKEITPTSFVINFLKHKGEDIKNILFFSQANTSHDALLTLEDNTVKRLDLTRAIDRGNSGTPQEVLETHLLRQNGGALVAHEIKRIKNKNGNYHYQDLSTSGILLSPAQGAQLLMEAFDEKTKKKNQYDWLIITIKLGGNLEDIYGRFQETCEIFRQEIIKKGNPVFDRIFVFLEDHLQKGDWVLKTRFEGGLDIVPREDNESYDKTPENSVWDSWASNHFREYKKENAH